MKLKAIKFFSPEENVSKTKVVEKAAPLPTGYISNSGKLVFPASALRDLGIDPESTHFKIGTQEGKRKIKSVYLVPAAGSDQTFSFEKSGRGHVIPLAGYFGEVDHLIPWQIDHLNVWRPVAEKSCRSSFKIS